MSKFLSLECQRVYLRFVTFIWNYMLQLNYIVMSTMMKAGERTNRNCQMSSFVAHTTCWKIQVSEQAMLFAIICKKYTEGYEYIYI